MKKHGILNPALCRAVARLGHRDQVVVADCGLPVPRTVPVVDLALVFGIPRFEQVLDALLAEIVVEECVLADETRGAAPEQWITRRIAAATYVSHEELKARTHDAAFAVRTGETTSYANVILTCGVPF
jgi:D-ribose pyranase